MNTRKFSLTTDGSSIGSGGAGAACLLRGSALSLFKVNAYLGDCDSLRAELIAGITGLLLFANQDIDSNCSLTWNTDCKVLVDGLNTHFSTWKANNWEASNGQVVKHLELWRCLERLRSKINLTIEHVSLASGSDTDLLACDRASRWAAKSGKQLLSKHGPGPQGRLSESDPEIAWNLVDMSRLELESLSHQELQAQIEEILKADLKSSLQSFLP